MTTNELIDRLRATSEEFSKIADAVEAFDHNWQSGMYHDEDDESSSSTSSDEDENATVRRKQAYELNALQEKLTAARKEIRRLKRK